MRPLRALLFVLAMTNVCGHRYHPYRRTRNIDAFNPDERKVEFWYDEAKAAIEKRLTRLQNTNIARNVIMFLGDGMSIPTISAARALKGQRANRTGEETQLFFESFPTVGLSKTYCLDEQIADSACTATAYLCGVKNNDGTIGVTGDVNRYDCDASLDSTHHLDSIAAWALADGRDAGIVTSARVTHASPAGAYAKVADRYWESFIGPSEWDEEEGDREEWDQLEDSLCSDIAHQLVHTYPANQFKVILGGGRREFIPETMVDEENTPGRRRDGRNLIQEWQNEKAERGVNYQYVWNRTELMSLMSSPPEYLLGLFEGSHMRYHLQADATMEPTLAELTEIAIRSLNRNEKGFFLFVESGRIDHAHHDNYVELSLDETLEMDLAIEKAVELLGDEDTLIVVTADHSHVLAYNGYTRRGGDILGPSDDIGDDGVPYMTLSYTNGPGARAHVDDSRIDVTQETNYRDLTWMSHADVPLGEETHGGDDVAVFAIGPYHHMFTGLYEQTQIPHLMAYAACIGPGLHACKSAAFQHYLGMHILVISLVLNIFRR